MKSYENYCKESYSNRVYICFRFSVPDINPAVTNYFLNHINNYDLLRKKGLFSLAQATTI